MKKFLSVLMVLVLICSSMLMLVACGGDGGNGGLNPDDITLGSLTEKPDEYSEFSNEYVTFYYPTSWYYDSGMDGCSVVDMTAGAGMNAMTPRGLGISNVSADLFIGAYRNRMIKSASSDEATVSEATMIKPNVYTIELSCNGQTATTIVIVSLNDANEVIYFVDISYNNRANMEQITTIINSIQFAN